MKWLLIVGSVLVVIILVTLIVGWSLPVKHTASQRATFAAPPDTVWKVLTDVEAFPQWRGDVSKVERLPDRDGRTAWVEDGKNGRITFAVERTDPPRLLVTRIADPNLPFGGSWTYEIAAASGGSTVTITEHGEIYNPIFRVMSRFVFGYDSTMASYLEALHKRL
jgi:polyketide cyclase/dehydrase/lipid transport protein